jgi:hypothetical protein
MIQKRQQANAPTIVLGKMKFFKIILNLIRILINMNIRKYPGWFAAFGTQKSLSWVQSNNIVAFFDSSDPNGNMWKSKYANKKIRLSKNELRF